MTVQSDESERISVCWGLATLGGRLPPLGQGGLAVTSLLIRAAHLNRLVGVARVTPHKTRYAPLCHSMAENQGSGATITFAEVLKYRSAGVRLTLLRQAPPGSLSGDHEHRSLIVIGR